MDQYRIPAPGDCVRVGSVPYEVVKVMQGGMASVIILHRLSDMFGDPIMRPRLACKMFWSHSITDEQILNEVNVWSSLSHPNIVPLLTLMPVSMRLSALMPVYDQTLGDLIQNRGPLPKKQTIAILEQLSSALTAANDQCDCVHLDIKPANVLISELSGEISFHLSDWGIATLHGLSVGRSAADTAPLRSHAETYSQWGTLPYMAPERLTGGYTASPAMDTFSLGILAFECLTGQTPYRSVMTQDLVHEIVHGLYIKTIRAESRLDRKTANFICNLTHPDPSHRIQSSADVRRELARIRGGLFSWIK